MNTQQRFAKFFERSGKQLSYFVEKPILEFTESLFARMEELEISNSELAIRLGCKPSYITKVLRGSTNFTLESMVKIALALDCELTPVRLTPKICSEKWDGLFEFPRKTPIIYDLFKSGGNMVEAKAEVIGEESNRFVVGNYELSLAA